MAPVLHMHPRFSQFSKFCELLEPGRGVAQGLMELQVLDPRRVKEREERAWYRPKGRLSDLLGV